MFDYLLVLFHRYSLYFLASLALIKFLVLLWYKPHRMSYAFRNFLNIYSRYAARDEKVARWNKFRALHNPLTVLFYILFLFWLISVFVFKFSVSHKTGVGPTDF